MDLNLIVNNSTELSPLMPSKIYKEWTSHPPVGIQTAIHSNTGSTHSVPSTSTTKWDMLKHTVSHSPANIAIGGILIALAACLQPCVKYRQF